jgi:hypothetical protein
MRKVVLLLNILFCLLATAGGREGAWTGKRDQSTLKEHRIAAVCFDSPNQDGELTAPGFVPNGGHLKAPQRGGSPAATVSIATPALKLHGRRLRFFPATDAANAYLAHIHPSHHFW